MNPKASNRSRRMERVESLLRDVVRWADERPDIVALGLIGSYARGDARPDSDVDLLILAENPSAYLDAWHWVERFGNSCTIAIEDWGKVQSLRVLYANGLEVEFGFALPEWAAIEPVDLGTCEVISDGLRVLVDRKNRFTSVQAAVLKQRNKRRSLPTLHVIVGLPGSGKTALAKQLELQRGALRLTPDEWVTRILGPEVTPAAEAAHDSVEALLWH